MINFENLFLLFLGQRGDINAGSLIPMLLLKAFNVELFHLIEDQLLLLLDKLKENIFGAHIFDRINKPLSHRCGATEHSEVSKD